MQSNFNTNNTCLNSNDVLQIYPDIHSRAGYIYQDTLQLIHTGNYHPTAYASTLSIPKDGNWWYFEAISNSIGIFDSLGLIELHENSEDYNNLKISIFANYLLNTKEGCRGIAVMLCVDTFLSIGIDKIGNPYKLIHLSNGIIDVFPKVTIGCIEGSTIKFIPNRKDQLFKPNLSLFSDDSIFKLPCNSLLNF